MLLTSSNILYLYSKISHLSDVSYYMYTHFVLDLEDKFQFGFKEHLRTTDNIFMLNSL